MKQIDLKKQKERWYKRSLSLQLFSMLLGIFLVVPQVNAQINWELGYPKWSTGSEILTVEGDEGLLEVYFTPSTDVANAAIEFTLPVNIQYAGTEDATAFTMSSTGNATTGQKVTAKLKAGTASASSPIQMKLKVKALCGAVTGTDLSVQVLSGTNAVSGSLKTATVQTQTPVIQMLAVESTVNYSAANQYETIEYKLSSSNGNANTFKVILTVDLYTTLQTFVFGGSTVTTVTEATTSTNRKYTLTLSDLSSTTEKVLSFEGTANRIGSHLVTPAVQYPAAKNCTTTDGQVVTMLFPSVAGVPVMEVVKKDFVASDGETVITGFNLNLDGSTPNMLRFDINNNSIFTAVDMTCQLTLDTHSYWDINSLYYQLEGEASREPVPVSWISTAYALASSTQVTYKDGVVGKARQVKITFPETVKLSGKKTITVWGSFTSGKIYNHEDKVATGTNSTKSCSIVFTGKNEGGVAGTPTPSTGISSAGSGHYTPTTASPLEFSIKPGASETQVVNLSTGHSGANNVAKRKVYIQLPSWLKLDDSQGDPFTWGARDGTIYPFSEAENGTTTPYRTYEVSNSIPFNTSAILTFKYTTNGTFAPTEENKTGEIVYWVDVDMNGTTLEKFVRVVQPVTLLCKEEGVSLNDFYPYRITRGLRDSDENHLPDSETQALDSEINHNIYMEDDKGEFRWNMTIQDASSYLYLPVTSPGFVFNGSSKHFDLKTDEIVMKVNNSSSSLKPEIVYSSDNKSFYLFVNASGVPFTTGQTIDIKLPFITVKNLTSTTLLTTECFVSDVLISDPFNSSGDSNRKGKDQKSQDMTIAYIRNYTYRNSAIFDAASNQEKEINGYVRMYPAGVEIPYFYKEFRQFGYASRVSLEIPDGYELSDNFKLATSRSFLDKEGPATQDLYPVSIAGNTYTYDFSSLYDFDYTTEDGPAPDPTKWILAEDYWSISFYYRVKALKGATIGASTVGITATYKNLKTSEDMVQAGTATFTYNGVATQLSNLPTSLPVNGSSLSIPVATIGNPNASTLDHVWLYVGGNVTDVKFNSASSGQGRWVNVGSLASGANKNYNITFSYLGRTDGENKNDTITVYTVSDFGDSGFPSDPTQYAIDSDELKDYLGARKNVILVPGAVKLGGSIDAGTSLTYNTEYNFQAVIDGSISPGLLFNPEMSIIIPAGQQYIPNSLSLDFRGTTGYDLSALEALLTADNNDPAVERPFTFSLKEILGEDVRIPGSLSTDPDDQVLNKRVATLTARFKPMCNTELTGIRFSGELAADNLTGTLSRLSPSMYPTISMDYTFTAGATIDGTDRAFNEEQTGKTLRVVIKKASGATANVSAADYIQLEMPDVLNITGTVNVTTAITGVAGTVSPTSNIPASGVRTIKIPVPATEINNFTHKGVGEDIEYVIPITYTASIKDGKHLVEAKYMSSAKFSAACNTSDMALDGEDVEIAILKPTASPYRVIVNEPVTLGMSTANFEGEWYQNSDRTGVLSSSTITPTATGDFTYYASAIIDGTDYGTVPVQVTVYPSLEFTVTNASICSGGNIDLSTLVSGAILTAGNTSVVKYYASNQSTVLSNTTVTPATATDYYVQAETHDGSLKSTMKKITISMNTPMAKPTATMSKNALEISTASGSTGSVTISVSGVSGTAATGGNYTYRLYDSNNAVVATSGNGRVDANTVVAISDTHTFTLTFDVPTAAATTYSYYVKVGGECGESQASDAITVTVYPDPVIALTSTAESYCSDNTSLQTGIDLWSFISSPNTTLYDYQYSKDGGAYTNLTSGSVSLAKAAGLHTYTIRSKNKYTSSLKYVDATFALTVHTPMAKPTAAMSENTLEISTASGSTGSVTISVSGVSGTPGTGGNYAYRLYDSSNAVVATSGNGRVDANTVVSTANTYTFTLTFDAPTTAATTYSYYVKVGGECGESQASDAVTVTVYPDPVIALTSTAESYCSDNTSLQTGIDLWSFISSPNTTLYDYQYSKDGGAFATLSSGATNLAKTTGLHTYIIRSKNKYTSSLKYVDATFALTVHTPMAKPTAIMSENTLEISTSSGSTGSVTVSVSGVSGTPGTGGNYTYRLYDSSNTVVATSGNGRVDANTVVSTANIYTFTLTFDAPTAATTTYSYYVKVSGECGESQSSDAVTVTVYPDPVIALTSTAESYCSGNTSLQSGIDLWSFISGPNTTLYDYQYSKDGGAFTNLTSGSVSLAKTAGLHTYTIRSKNKYTSSLKYMDATFALTVHTPMTKPIASISASALEISTASGSTGSVTISVSGVSGTPGTGGNYTYRLYDSSNAVVAISGNGRVDANTVVSTANTHTFTLTFDVPTATSTAYNYYVKVSGECGESAASDAVYVTVYPVAELTLTVPASAEICDNDAAALADIGLWSYIDGSDPLLTYQYNDGNGYQALTSSSIVSVSASPGSYTYQLKAVNAKGTESAEKTVEIAVQGMPVINGITGNEVTEGDAVNIVVSASGIGTLSYIWQEESGGNWSTLTTTTTNTYQITPSAIMGENGKRFRVLVSGGTTCSNAQMAFTLKVNSSTTPPLGNNKVTWEVIGYGKAMVTADGLSISNGSHVNNGTKLMITGSTWLSNILKSIIVNGTEYSNSPVSYTVNGGDVHIVVEFLGSDPNPDPNSNTEIGNTTRVWTEGGYACMYTETASRVRIVTFNGRIVIDQKIPEGESRIQLPDGYYIVTLSDGTIQKIAIRNF